MEAGPHDPKGHMTPGGVQGPHKTPCKVWEGSHRPIQKNSAGWPVESPCNGRWPPTFPGPEIDCVTPSDFRRPQRPS